MADGWSYIWNPVCFVVWSCFVSSEVSGTNLSITDHINQACDSSWYAVKWSPALWRIAFVDAMAALRSNRRVNWSVDWNATKLRPESAPQNFCWKPEMTVWCISVQACDWIRALGQFVAMIFFTARRCLAEGKKRSDSEMWWRYNGVLHRSAQNYWPLCRFSLSPTHLPQHPHSSAVHQAGLSGNRTASSHVVQLLYCFTISVFSFNGKAQSVAGSARAHHSVGKCHQLKRDGDILNYRLASKLASLTIFFLSAIPLLIVPSWLFPISFAFYNIEIERNPELEVIWNSPNKPNCFPPCCWFLSAKNGRSFLSPSWDIFYLILLLSRGCYFPNPLLFNLNRKEGQCLFIMLPILVKIGDISFDAAKWPISRLTTSNLNWTKKHYKWTWATVICG